MLTLRLTFSWLTVLPVRGPAEVDRRAAARAIALAPIAGLTLGLAAAAVLWLLEPAGAAAGFAAVAVLALLTRGMHLDGLADTFDGLGVYGPPERAREVMKSGGAGPFGVSAIVVAAGIQAGAFTALAASGHWYAVILAVALGRVAVVAACRRGIEPAPDTRFGALVAGTQSWVTVAVWVVVTAAVSVFAVPGLVWPGPLVAVLSLLVAVRLADHGARRIGGLSGDLLGAAVELTTALSALGFVAAANAV
ncbi:adenosylcobinamide-GDP ribazoletransferase [Nocardia flavorosea]|uniref:adenosylcobinamide-GDP ribazoletransferase n=1 Tax=Nocardia flavorosea TaxID=53429 RepID=UPI000AC5AAD5|nr:adenosylcobinamide-GDP ribazoletransferase [Nocardia flavorosea]